MKLEELECELAELIKKAEEQGLVFTVSLANQKPLATGNVKMVTDVRLARKTYQALEEKT